MRTNRFNLLFSFAAMLVAIFSMTSHIDAQTYWQPKLHSARWKVSNRTITYLHEDKREIVRFDSRPLDGIAWLEETEFANGTIEFDVRGKNELQRSFVGLAFHGADDDSFEAIYFRPFNFKNPDPARRVRAVQYQSLPDSDWKTLRAKFPNLYEKAVNPVPDPDGWIRVRVVINHPQVQVFVNDARESCLEVKQLSTRKKGKIGFWVGDNSDGDFANLRIQLERN